MSCYHTYERYDENEYFLKFKEIHPYLYYANDKYNIEKKKFQLKLLDKLENKILTEEQFTDIYKLLMIKENNKYTHLAEIKKIHTQILKNEEEQLDNEIHDFIQFII